MLNDDIRLARPTNHQRVEDIAARPEYADDRDLQLERAEARCHLAYAHCKHSGPRETAEAATRVEDIAKRPEYADDRDLQLERAAAWRYLAYAHMKAGQVPATEAAYEWVVRLCADHDEWLTDERDGRSRIELARAHWTMWRAYVTDPVRRATVLAEIEAMARRFPGDPTVRSVWEKVQAHAPEPSAVARSVGTATSSWIAGTNNPAGFATSRYADTGHWVIQPYRQGDEDKPDDADKQDR